MSKPRKARDRRKRRKASRLALPAPDTLPVSVGDPGIASARDHETLANATPAVPITAITPVIGLLETSRTKWQYGEWTDLASLQQDDIVNDPDRGKLALLIAAGNAHEGDTARARHFGRLAALWGCNRRLISQVMISTVHNSLGRLSISLDEDEAAGRHFETALELVEARADATLLGRTRRIRETARMGLLLDATRLLGADLITAEAAPIDHAARLAILKSEVDMLHRMLSQPMVLVTDDTAPKPDPSSAAKPQNAPPPVGEAITGLPADIAGTSEFSARAFSILSGMEQAGERHFVYLDTKSLPRSGLHYLKESLKTIIGNGFSFCEWYQEPGCCRKMPCAVTGYATGTDKAAGMTLRMVKSHDFQLTNIAYPTHAVLRRLILVRDPLFVLTSWWNLDLLATNGALLRALGLNPVLLYFRHEPQILAEAYRAISAEFIPPPLDKLQDWLRRRKAYLLGFVRKWADPGALSAHQTLLRYDAISDWVLTLLHGQEQSLSEDQKDRLDSYRTTRETGFVLRRDPFAAPTPELAAFLQTHADLFRLTALETAAEDSTGTLVMEGTS